MSAGSVVEPDSIPPSGAGSGVSLGRELALGIALAALFVASRGYAFGIDDHAIHLAYIDRARDPGFLPGDPMLALAPKHPSFLFALFGWLSSLMPMSLLFGIAQGLSVLAAVLGLRALARSLWPGQGSEWISLVAIAAFIVPHPVGGGITDFDTMFLPRGATYGPLLYALSLCVRGRWAVAFALIGFVFLFHATTAAHAAALAGGILLSQARERWAALLLGPVIFLAAASPLLFMMIKSGGSGIPSPAPADWIAGVKLHYPGHHFEQGFVLASYFLASALGVTLGILASPWRGAGRVLAGCLIAVSCLYLIGIVGNYKLHSPITIALHVFQSGRLLDALAMLGLSRWAWCGFRISRRAGTLRLFLLTLYVLDGTLRDLHPGGDYPADLHYLVVTLFVLLAEIVALVMTVDGQLVGRRAARKSSAIEAPATVAGNMPGKSLAWALLGLAAVCATLSPDRLWMPTGREGPGSAVMAWSSRHLPSDAVVLLPPYMINQPVTAFRHFAQRRCIGTWKDGGEGTFDLAFQRSWNAYVQDAFGDPTKAGDSYLDMLDRLDTEFQTMPAAKLSWLAAKYGADHVLREANAPALPFPVVYRDGEYVLYRMKLEE